ncbi:hypothetical protein [Bergeyella sp. RCAD1439]|uniref:hypothetical protein n=1 Tax=Bergeyella anatis TaxID=3113737 RepID=UPI002E185993|nr:hypothetical protein [Bergeyella sp. RCAD1439]
MKNTLQLTVIFILYLLINSCKGNNDNISSVNNNNETVIEDEWNKNTQTIVHENDSIEYEENDEFISNFLFNQWKGKYELVQEDLIDGWGRESMCFTELVLIAPDSCIYRSWLADENGKRYAKEDNYQEYVGGMVATSEKDSIEFYTKKVLAGGNNTLSPLLTLTKSNDKFYLHSVLIPNSRDEIHKISVDK